MVGLTLMQMDVRAMIKNRAGGDIVWRRTGFRRLVMWFDRLKNWVWGFSNGNRDQMSSRG